MNESKKTTLSDCFESFTADCFSELLSSRLFKTSNQDHIDKGIRTTADCVCGVLNDKFVAGLLSLL